VIGYFVTILTSPINFDESERNILGLLQKAKNDAIHNKKTSTVNTKKFGFDMILI
jgi:hypothetical protein